MKIKLTVLLCMLLLTVIIMPGGYSYWEEKLNITGVIRIDELVVEGVTGSALILEDGIFPVSGPALETAPLDIDPALTEEGLTEGDNEQQEGSPQSGGKDNNTGPASDPAAADNGSGNDIDNSNGNEPDGENSGANNANSGSESNNGGNQGSNPDNPDNNIPQGTAAPEGDVPPESGTNPPDGSNPPAGNPEDEDNNDGSGNPQNPEGGPTDSGNPGEGPETGQSENGQTGENTATDGAPIPEEE